MSFPVSLQFDASSGVLTIREQNRRTVIRMKALDPCYMWSCNGGEVPSTCTGQVGGPCYCPNSLNECEETTSAKVLRGIVSDLVGRTKARMRDNDTRVEQLLEAADGLETTFTATYPDLVQRTPWANWGGDPPDLLPDL